MERVYSFKELKEMNLECSDEFYKSIVKKEDNSFGFERYKNHLMEGATRTFSDYEIAVNDWGPFLKINRKRDVSTESTKGLEDLTKFINKLIKENLIHHYVYKSFDEEYNQFVYNAGIGVYTSANEVYLKEAELRKKWIIENENTKKNIEFYETRPGYKYGDSNIDKEMIEYDADAGVVQVTQYKDSVVVKNESLKVEPFILNHLRNDNVYVRIQEKSEQINDKPHERKNISEQSQLQRSKNYMSKSNSVIVGKVVKPMESVAVNDKNVGKFSVVVDSKEKDSDGKPITTFYNVESWNERYNNEVLQESLKSDETVMLNGQVVIEPYEKDGKKETNIKVVNPEVTFIGKSKASAEKIFVAGRLTKDVEIIEINNGKGDKVAKFTIAENYGEDKTNYFDVEVWNSKADHMQKHIEKGSLVKVSGDLQIRKYEHKGIEGTSTKIINADVNFLSKSANRLEAEKSVSGKTTVKASSNNKGAVSK